VAVPSTRWGCSPAVIALEEGECTNPWCADWRFGEEFDRAAEE
jgi:hypothetical protein